jgi:hypothetical protein
MVASGFVHWSTGFEIMLSAKVRKGAGIVTENVIVIQPSEILILHASSYETWTN